MKKFVVETFICSEEDRKKAFDSMGAASEEDDYLDSDLEDIVSCLDEEDANALDLKEMKAKKRRKRLQGKAGDKMKVPDREQEPKKKGKGKGRGRGRGRNSEQGRGKGRGRFGVRKGGKRTAEPASQAEKHPSGELAFLPHDPPEVEQHEVASLPPDPPEGEQHAADEPASLPPDPPEVEQHDAPDEPAALPPDPPEGEQHVADEPASLPHGPPEGEQHVADDAPASLPHGPPEVAPDEAASLPAGPSGVKRPKVYTTPAEDLAGMMPPGAKIVLSHNEHRFLTTWVGPTHGIPEEMKGKHFTRNFGPNRSWQMPCVNVIKDCGRSGATLPPHCLYLQASSLRNLVWYQMKFWQQWSITLANCQRRRTIPPKGESVPVLSKEKRSLPLHCMHL